MWRRFRGLGDQGVQLASARFKSYWTGGQEAQIYKSGVQKGSGWQGRDTRRDGTECHEANGDLMGWRQ